MLLLFSKLRRPNSTTCSICARQLVPIVAKSLSASASACVSERSLSTTAQAAAESVLPSSKSIYQASKTRAAFQSEASGKTIMVVAVVEVAVEDGIAVTAVELFALRRFVIVGVEVVVVIVVVVADGKSL